MYPPEELRSAIERYIGQTVTFDAVPEIEEAIARKYRSEGYILARALAPENQSLDPAGAVLKIVVFEGYIDKVRLDPLDYEVGERGERVRDILKKIERGCRDGDSPAGDQPCPLHRSVLERYLLLANDLPGVKASAVIQPAQEAAGGADLFVTITEKWYQGFVKGDNRGTVYSGPFRGDIGASLNNLTDFYERTSVRVIAANPLDELLLYDINESLPISSEGTVLLVGFNQSQSKPATSCAMRTSSRRRSAPASRSSIPGCGAARKTSSSAAASTTGTARPRSASSRRRCSTTARVPSVSAPPTTSPTGISASISPT